MSQKLLFLVACFLIGAHIADVAIAETPLENSLINRATTCVPRDVLAGLGFYFRPLIPLMQCQVGTSCRHSEDHSECTVDKIDGEVYQSFNLNKGYPDQATFLRKMVATINSGVCQCE